VLFACIVVLHTTRRTTPMSAV